MRLAIPLLLAAASAGPALGQPPVTADTFRDAFIEFVVFVVPTPNAILPGIDLPIRAGDRIIANCAQAYQYTLPEMTPAEQADFNASVTCVFPPEAEFQQSIGHYSRALAERGFKDDTGDYAQSAMRIMCSEAYTVAMSIQADFIPSFVVDPETDDIIDVPGGGAVANVALTFSVSDRGCRP